MTPLYLKKTDGYIMLTALIFVAVFITISSAMINAALQQGKNTTVSTMSAQAIALADAGLDNALYQMNQNQSFVGESNITLGNGVYTTVITSIGSNSKTITSTGYIPNSSNPVVSRTVKVTVNIGQTNISFRYGVQVGNGGFLMNGGSVLNGSIYSNGSIIATNGVTITGGAIAANPPSLTADQTNDTPTPISSCTSSTCVTFANAAATEDFAQSFKISSAVSLNNIQFYIKKVGAPADATIRIFTDSSGSPGTQLMTGTLPSASVSTTFGWVSVAMPTTPVLDPAQTYWIVIDAASNASKNYIIGANSDGYANGTAKIGKNGGTWSATSPSGLDGYFKIYLGGGTSVIGSGTYVGSVNVGTSATDDAWAHTVQGASVTGTIYCQTGSTNNKSCNTSKGDPPAQSMPMSDQNIQDWKDDAAAGGVTAGNVTVGSAGANMGPTHITGNLLVNGGGTLNLTGTVWVDGTIIVASGGKMKLDSSYGANSGAIIADGSVNVSGGGTFAGSGSAGSYPFLVTTSSCPAAPGCGGADAITLTGGAGTVALIAQNGNITINGGSAIKAVTGKQVTMTGGASLTYDSGLISENFSSGPGGSWEFVPGSYSITH
jgi:hypothetical protein